MLVNMIKCIQAVLKIDRNTKNAVFMQYSMSVHMYTQDIKPFDSILYVRHATKIVTYFDDAVKKIFSF